MNMGYVVGLLPVTGVQLPLISAGGTSLVLTLFIVGLLARFARCEPEALVHQRAQHRGRLARLLVPMPTAAVEPIPPSRAARARAAARDDGRTVARVPAPAGRAAGSTAPRPRREAPGGRDLSAGVRPTPAEQTSRRDRQTVRGRLPAGDRPPLRNRPPVPGAPSAPLTQQGGPVSRARTGPGEPPAVRGRPARSHPPRTEWPGRLQ
jgi:cell division protein FtsW